MSPRTLLTLVAPATVIVATWLRLESPADRWWRVAAVAALAVVPAVVRPRWAIGLVAGVVALRLALGAWPLHPLRLASRFGHGFVDFYDVKTPFDPRVHTEMRGVVLVAIFAFVLAVGVAVAQRRTAVAVGALLLGAGWPATLAGNAGAVWAGTAILVATLALLAGLTSRRVPRVVVPAVAAVVLAALLASASSAVAKNGAVHWQRWDFYNAPVKPVSVDFAWNADYEGISFPAKRTTVLEIEAPPRSLYWRAAVLDNFAQDRWLLADPYRGDSLEPPVQGSALLKQKVHVRALTGTRLVGASVPRSFDAGDAPLVSSSPGFAELRAGLARGFTYRVQSYAPTPSGAALASTGTSYPAVLTARGQFLDVWPGVTAPAFGQPRLAFLDRHQEILRYTPLLRAAVDVAGDARTPYAATMALLRWFRVNGGFRYTSKPPVDAAAPLVGFVAETRAGYCQHFAGAMALMLRYLGIPARVAVGFSSGTYDASRHRWVVTDHEAHAWVEAWFPGYGWLPFDPTPPLGRPERGQLTAPYSLLSSRTGSNGPGASTGTDNNSATARHHGEQGTGVQPGFGASDGGTSRHGSSLVLLLLIVVGGVAGGVAATKLARRRVRYLTRDPRRVAGACRQELAEYLLDQQIEGARSATLHELGALVRHELAVDPDAFVAAATAARFGPPAGSDAAARVARRELRVLLRRIRRRLGTRDRLRGVLSLRSLGFAA